MSAEAMLNFLVEGELTPVQLRALRRIAKDYLAAIERERKRWGEESARGVEKAGIDPPNGIARRTLSALHRAGLIVVDARSQDVSTLRRGAYGRRTSGAKHRTAVTSKLVTVTKAGFAALQRAKGVTEARVTKRDALIRDARAAGMEVSERGSTVDIIAKLHARTGRVLKGIRLYDNGTAVDMTVDLSVAKAIRGDRAIRKMIGL